eukprot:IDg20921t1
MTSMCSTIEKSNKDSETVKQTIVEIIEASILNDISTADFVSFKPKREHHGRQLKQYVEEKVPVRPDDYNLFRIERE